MSREEGRRGDERRGEERRDQKRTNECAKFKAGERERR